MRTLSNKEISSFCDIIHNEPDQRIKDKLAAWADQYVNNTDSNVDFGFLSGIVANSKVKTEIEEWIGQMLGTSTVTVNVEQPVTETTVETPNTVIIDVDTTREQWEEEPATEEVVEEVSPTEEIQEPTSEEPIIEKPKRKRKPL